MSFSLSYCMREVQTVAHIGEELEFRGDDFPALGDADLVADHEGMSGANDRHVLIAIEHETNWPTMSANQIICIYI